MLIRSVLQRHLFAFVWLPRDELTTARRVAIGEMLGEAANGSLLNWSIALEDGVVALIRYTIDLRQTGACPTRRRCRSGCARWCAAGCPM